LFFPQRQKPELSSLWVNRDQGVFCQFRLHLAQGQHNLIFNGRRP
jgi:hypothetical protein